MVSNFQKILNQAKEEGNAKLKIIAPKYNSQTVDGVYKRGSGSSSEVDTRMSIDMEAIRQNQLRTAREQAIAQEQARLEQLKLDQLRQKLLRENAQRRVVQSKDSRTGNRLVIETIQDRNRRLNIVRDTVTGTTIYNVMNKTPGGRKTSEQYSMSGSSPVADNKKKTSGEMFKDYIRDYQNNYGMSSISTRGNLEEASSWFLNQKANNNIKIQRLDSEIKKLKSQGRELDAFKLVREKQKLKNELFGYTVGQTLTRTLMGMSQIPAIARTIYSEPRAIIPISLAIWEGTKADWKDTWQLARVSPGQAVAKIGTDYFTFAFISKGLKMTGKVSVEVAKKLNPQWNKFKYIIKKVNVPKRVSNYVVKIPGVNVIGTSRPVKIYSRKIREIKKSQLTEIKKFKSAVEYKRQLDIARIESKKLMSRAKEIRKKLSKISRTMNIGDSSYINAVAVLEDYIDLYSKNIANKFINKIKKQRKIGLGEEQEIANKVKIYYSKKLTQNPQFIKIKEYARLNTPYTVKLIKVGKIKSAKILLKNTINRIGRIPIINKASLKIGKVRGGLRTSVRKISRARRGVNRYISTARTNVRLRKERKSAMKNAKRIRKLSSIRGRTMTVGNNDFSRAITILENLSDTIAIIKTRKFIKNYIKNGGKITSEQSKMFTEAVIKKMRNNLYQMNEFIKIKEYSRLNTPYTVKLIKVGKIKSAKILLKNVSKRVENFPLIKYIKSVGRNIKKYPSRIKKQIKTKILQSRGRKLRMQTIRYKMEMARPLRKVTLDQLARSSNISKMNNFIDYFFDNMGRRQKLDISAIKFKQMKNLLKKRMKIAIKRNDMVEINRFRDEVRKIIYDMNKRTNSPDVKVIEKIGSNKRIRTIKDFEPESPKGTYTEVKVGNQVQLQLQEVKTKVRGKMQGQMQKQKMKVISVARKRISIRPLIMFGIKSLSASAIRNMQKSRQGVYKISNQAQLLKTLQDSGQDLRILQIVSQDIMSSSAIASAVAQDVNSKIKSKLKPGLKQIYEKNKKIPKFKTRINFSKKTLSKSQPTYYVVEKVRGKLKKLYPKPLTLKDARDYAVYSIDNKLSKTAFFVPLGKSKIVIMPPKQIQNYASRNSYKVRPYRIRMGKKKQLVNGFIEKRKYFQDTRGEKLQSSRLRSLSNKRRTPTRRVVKRKITPQQRRVLIARLKMARAVRMRNLRRK